MEGKGIIYYEDGTIFEGFFKMIKQKEKELNII